MPEIHFIEQSCEILRYIGDDPIDISDTPVGFIASVARTCYRSEPKGPGLDSPYSDVRIEAENEANERLVRALVKNGHHAMLEFGWIAARVITDRAIANEIVRHRLFSFAQESTRYVNYNKRGFEFIMPPNLDEDGIAAVTQACFTSVAKYDELIKSGVKPEIARNVLPLCLATRLCIAGNIREWRHLFELRTSRDAHPQIRALFMPMLKELKDEVPILFDDIEPWE